MNNSRVLGQLLIAAGHISEEQLVKALRRQRTTRERLGEILIKEGLPARCIAQALAQQLRLHYADPPLQPEPAAFQLIDRSTAARLRVLPLSVREKTVRVAMADPLDMSAVDDLQFRTGKRVEPVVAEPAAIESALAAFESEAPTVVATVEHILRSAVQARASDIHIEPAAEAVVVRGRVDGVLRELLTLPKQTNAAVVSRIKVMAALDISVKRKPQDGRTSVRVNGRDISARISTLPANGGEKVVVRLLDGGEHFASLDDLGLSEQSLNLLRAMLQHPHGVVLVTGPTGSGKSTTLYAALSELDRQTRNIITLEDPVEYKIAGITQVQVDRRAGLTFPRVLRAVLRQDPDIIMIGEMRDRETVEVALAAAMTGHLVLSTLHTNDAPSAVARLFDMGAPPYLVAASLVGVVAQRLVRRVCPACRTDGCSACQGSGFRGRVGVYEILPINPELAALIGRRTSAQAIRKAGRDNGMTSLAEDARRKVDLGLTTAAEAAPLLGLAD
ncbi:MAG TPA: GspE/PulE family protein [Burkholderiales bacterium]|nr:GspE/PulE family protein [Burkholderiales bacterium]